MKKSNMEKTSFAEKIVEIIRTSPSINEMREQLQDYHDNDIAQSLHSETARNAICCTAHLMRNGWRR